MHTIIPEVFVLSNQSLSPAMGSYAKYSLVPTDEPDKAAAALDGTSLKGGSTGFFGNLLNPTHKPPNVNRSTLPQPPNSAFDYSSAFNFKSAFDYNSGSPNQYQSAFDYGYSRKPAEGLSAASGKKGACRSCEHIPRTPAHSRNVTATLRDLILSTHIAYFDGKTFGCMEVIAFNVITRTVTELK